MSDRRRRRFAVVVAVGWIVSLAVVLVWWRPLELVHVFGSALATLGVAEYVLSAWRWRLEVRADELVVTPTMGAADRIPRSCVLGVDEPATSPPTIVVDRPDDVVLPVGTHLHAPALRDLLGTVPGRRPGEVPEPPGPFGTLKGFVAAPNATLRSFAHHPRPILNGSTLGGTQHPAGLCTWLTARAIAHVLGRSPAHHRARRGREAPSPSRHLHHRPGRRTAAAASSPPPPLARAVRRSRPPGVPHGATVRPVAASSDRTSLLARTPTGGWSPHGPAPDAVLAAPSQVARRSVKPWPAHWSIQTRQSLDRPRHAAGPQPGAHRPGRPGSPRRWFAASLDVSSPPWRGVLGLVVGPGGRL